VRAAAAALAVAQAVTAEEQIGGCAS
jgi:hypothetical protein